MRTQLKQLIARWRQIGLYEPARAVESILATEPPAVTVRAGWVCKDRDGLFWFDRKPCFVELYGWTIENGAWDEFGSGITDPWPDKPNGGPECLVEVK